MVLFVFAVLVVLGGVFIAAIDALPRITASSVADVAIALLLGPFILLGLSFMVAFAVVAAPVMLPMILVWSRDEHAEPEGTPALRPVTV